MELPQPALQPFRYRSSSRVHQRDARVAVSLVAMSHAETQLGASATVTNSAVSPGVEGSGWRDTRVRARARGTLTAVLGIVDHLRRRFARFKLCAHPLDLRRLLVEMRSARMPVTRRAFEAQGPS